MRRAASAQALALRARIVLACAGPETSAVARDLRVSADTVRKWRRRFLAGRLDGLTDEPRPGRPPTISVGQVEAVVVTTLDNDMFHPPANPAAFGAVRSPLHAGEGNGQAAAFGVGRSQRASRRRTGV
ncbi:helix-turn-helix domain-containing protein [Streptomyces sp. NPDC021080]|uniref:helix-turn-helix domain-containing protein n=1 Tax=Streptomyces sp. NPDC021080 TaxID=3365110 RepID=UPI00379EA0E3